MFPCITIHDLNKYYHYLWYTIHTLVLKMQKMNKIQMQSHDQIYILKCKSCNERNIHYNDIIGIGAQFCAVSFYTTS